ncbi:MATE family efflux transporter [Clostridium sp. P21]|uniref:Probable multidrug resistance protein NorM n=1 Tax=Clostridium muellerianum TaxID=2716538 RepID=A0A7Y0EFQ2_9CLOT|nr:MATE family efflux transporter [Clostridium muellerianum]NMM61615.1 MATE family efflux transporter [Clostridium muellerianum]
MFDRSTIKDVLDLAFPAVGEMILYMMIWVFDTMMVGQYGGNVAVSSVGLGSEILYTFSNIFIAMGLSVGITSLVARQIGAKNLDLAEEYLSIGFLLALIISVVIFLLTFFFCDNILKVAGATGEVIYTGKVFMKIASFGILFYMLMNVLNATLRGCKNTRTPLIASILVNIVNLSLDWLLIFGHYGFPALGVKGAAIATCSAQISGFLFILFYTIKKSKIKPKLKYITNLNLKRLKELLKLSIPASFQEAAFSTSRLLCVFMIMHLGNIAFAANQIVTTIESVSYMPGWGFAVAGTTLAGHKFGEKNFKRAKEYAYTCMILGTILMAFCAILYIIFPGFFINLFINSKEKDVIRLGTLCLMVAAAEQIPMAISMILGGALKGIGDTKTPFLISLVSSWVLRLPLMFYFVYILKVSVVYVWWITTIQWAFEGIVMAILFKRKFRSLSKQVQYDKTF